jgi:riboflavin biosynthesis pyrimidine reductase
VLYFAPKLLGSGARAMFAFEPVGGLESAVELDIVERRSVGADLRIVARPSTVAAAQKA